MRVLKLSAILFILVLSAGALANSASAANPEFLDNVTGNTFWGESAVGRLKAGAFTIECKKDMFFIPSGKVTGSKTLEAPIAFENCQLLGLATNSLGDPAKTILVAAKGTLCYISKAAKTVGVEFQITPVHIEVPSVGELVEVTGTALGAVKTVNTLSTANTITLNETTSKEKCEGGKAVELKTEKEHDGKLEAGLETTTEEVTFDKDIELDA